MSYRITLNIDHETLNVIVQYLQIYGYTYLDHYGLEVMKDNSIRLYTIEDKILSDNKVKELLLEYII